MGAEGGCQRVHHSRSGEHVAGCGEPGTGRVLGGGHAAGPGVPGGPAIEAQHRQLAPIRRRITSNQPGDDLVGRQAVPQQPQAVRAEGDVDQRLGRHRSAVRPGVQDQRADGEELRGHGGTGLPRLRIVKQDGEGHGGPPISARTAVTTTAPAEAVRLSRPPSR